MDNLNEELIKQLTRIADSLERAFPEEPNEENSPSSPNAHAWKKYSEFSRNNKSKL